MKTIGPGYKPEHPVFDFYKTIDLYCQSLTGADREKRAIQSLLKPGDILFFSLSYKDIDAYKIIYVLDDELILTNSTATKIVSFDSLLDRKGVNVIGVELKNRYCF